MLSRSFVEVGGAAVRPLFTTPFRQPLRNVMTEPLQECLSTDKLRDYALGRMPAEQCERVASHIETCVTCEDTISSLDGTADSMLDHLRMPPSQSVEGTPEYLAAMAKLQHQSGQGAPTSSQAGDAELSGHFDGRNPEVVRDYELIAMLGAGGMGTVYKAIHTKLDRVVALKLLPTRRIGNADAVVRFEREMKAIGKLDHPAIVRATDAGEDDGQHFLAMEFVDGFDVSELVDRHGPLSTPDACEIIRQAAVGLQHVHERQLVHRDIKPSNLMVTEDGQVKILDFGAGSPGRSARRSWRIDHGRADDGHGRLHGAGAVQRFSRCRYSRGHLQPGSDPL